MLATRDLLRRSGRLFSTETAPSAKLSILESIQDLKREQKEAFERRQKNKRDYTSKMSSSAIDKIGSQTLLDKQWAQKPKAIIRNPHKLTEIELYKTLEKIVEMPEHRLRQMVLSNEQVNEVFMTNMAERVPYFLTPTIVNIVKVLAIKKDLWKDHEVWVVLERELLRRASKLNNPQLATVIHAFGTMGIGSKAFFDHMEEQVIESPIPIETEYLEKILTGYSQIDIGTA